MRQSQVGCCPCGIRWTVLTSSPLAPLTPPTNWASFLELWHVSVTLDLITECPQLSKVRWHSDILRISKLVWPLMGRFGKCSAMSLAIHGDSPAEGQRIGERTSLHVNQAAFANRPLWLHLFENSPHLLSIFSFYMAIHIQLFFFIYPSEQVDYAFSSVWNVLILWWLLYWRANSTTVHTYSIDLAPLCQSQKPLT